MRDHPAAGQRLRRRVRAQRGRERLERLRRLRREVDGRLEPTHGGEPERERRLSSGDLVHRVVVDGSEGRQEGDVSDHPVATARRVSAAEVADHHLRLDDRDDDRGRSGVPPAH